MQPILNLKADDTNYIIEQIDSSFSILHHMMKQLVKNNDREHLSTHYRLRCQYQEQKLDNISHVFELNYGGENNPDQYTVGVLIDEEDNYRFYKNANSESIIDEAQDNDCNDKACDAISYAVDNEIDIVKPKEINYLDDMRKYRLLHTIKNLEDDYYNTFKPFLLQNLAQREYELRHMFDKPHDGMDILVETAEYDSERDFGEYEWHRLPDDELAENEMDYQIVNYNAPLRIIRDERVGELNEFARSCAENHLKSMLDVKMFLQHLVPAKDIPGCAVYKNTKETINKLLAGKTPADIAELTRDVNPKQEYIQQWSNGSLSSYDKDEVEGDCEVDAGLLLALYFDKVLKHPNARLADKNIERNSTYDII